MIPSEASRLCEEVELLSCVVRRCQALAGTGSIDAPIIDNLLDYIDALVDELANEMGPRHGSGT